MKDGQVRYDWKEGFRFWLFVLVGAFLTSLINWMLGIDLVESVGMVKTTIHTVMYMVWGAVFYRYSLKRPI